MKEESALTNIQDGCFACAPCRALIAKVLAGRCQMRYTRAAVGSGDIPEGVHPRDLTEVPGYVMDAKISAASNPVDGECQVGVQINSEKVETGFFATGILLYAQDPDEGEVPYAYLRMEDGPEWIRPASSLVGKLATFELIAVVGDVNEVFADIHPDSILTRAAAQKLMEDHNKDPEAHAALVSTLKEKLADSAVFAFAAEDWGPPASWEPEPPAEDEAAEGAESSEYDGSLGYEIAIPAEAHRRKNGDFGFHVFHQVDSKYITNTWAALGTGADYDGEAGTVILSSSNPYPGKILFVG
jgi:hypothetical protein